MYFGDNCLVSIFSDLQIFLINLDWSSVSIIVKLDFKFTAGACLLNSLAQIEWKVPSHGKPVVLVLRIAPTLFCISFAALLVKVTANIWFGKALFSFIKFAILEVSTLVLPEPAPATIKRGPSRWVTAFFCASFKNFKKSEFIILNYFI